jgi:phosphoglycolate phosphatase-like HAD superfamily hydrolase
MSPFPPAPALVLFDIDGTLIRRAGPHHREALVEAVRRVAGVETTTENIAVQGMLDCDILRLMMMGAGFGVVDIRKMMPALIREAQSHYVKSCPDLTSKVSLGALKLLQELRRRGIPTGLVTGNLTRIGWKKMERAGIKRYFRFGAFAESARDRAGLARRAIRHASRQGWITPESRISLIGDHENDIAAARMNGIQAIAVATGLSSAADLAACRPDILLPDLQSLQLEMLL